MTALLDLAPPGAPTPTPAPARQSLLGLPAPAMERLLGEVGLDPAESRLRARQILGWLYRRGADDLEAMTDLPKPLRVALAAGTGPLRPGIAAAQASVDGTRKWLLRLEDGREVETVYIPENRPDGERGALCVSTQVGCTLSCAFCHTGTMPLVRNLTAGEIVAQILVARDALADWRPARDGRRLTNIVVMGMGEPLFNYENTAAALRIAMDPEGIDLARRRITLSTSGVVPRIEQAGRELGCGLAVSLHAVRDDLRDTLVPLNRKWPIAQLLEACRRYPVRGRPITFEYVMLDRVNDSPADARELARLLHGLAAKVNLIPFNPWPGTIYSCSPDERIRAFAGILRAKGIHAFVRTPRGRDILAACGQLKTASERARGPRAAMS